MKKLLNLLATTSLITSLSSTTIACGKGRLSTTITYGIVDNGVDVISRANWKEIEEKYYSIYGTKYTLKAQEEVDDNKLPNKILGAAGLQASPDIYTASSDMVSKLAVGNYILALNGKDAPPFMEKILTDLNYNVEYANKVLEKPINEWTAEEEWGTFLPYAIESSNMVNNNEHSQNNGEKAQYGIARGLGIGGGSSIVRKDLNPILNEIGFKYTKNENGEDTNNLDPKGSTTLKRMSDYSASKKNEVIPMLIDRGMWEMYPFYSNIISDDIMGKVYKASEIGVNWINDPSLSYYNDEESKYSSIFSNPFFEKSTTEIMKAFFNYFAQLYKVALYKLSGKDAANTAANLLSPKLNLNVQKSMAENKLTTSTTTEPASYASFIKGAKSFRNMEFVDMNSIKIFDEEKEKQLADIYNKHNLNKWMTPAGSNMFVFSKKLGTDKEKALASMRFVQLALGFQEDKDGTVSSDGTGGIFNLEKGFINASVIPSRIAINNPKLTESSSFNESIKTIKAPRRVKAALEIAPVSYRKEYEGNETVEINAIVELEKYAIGLASRMYDANSTLSLAPNISAYDFSGEADLHGTNVMRPNLGVAFDKDKKTFQDIYGKFGEPIVETQLFKDERTKFIKKFLKGMAKLNSER